MIFSNFTPNYPKGKYPKGKLLKISEYCRDEINFDFKYLRFFTFLVWTHKRLFKQS